MTFRFDHPEFLWLLLLGAPIVWLGVRSLAQLEPVRRWTSIGLRLAVLLVLVLMLAGLQMVQRHEELTVVAVMDQSESVRRFGQAPGQSRPGGAGGAGEQGQTVDAWVQGFLRGAMGEKRQGDRLGLVTYDGRSTVRDLPTEAPTLEPGTIERPESGTDTAAGIRTGMALFPADTGARMLLVTDGNDTAGGSGGAASGGGGGGVRGEGDVLAAAREAAAAGIPIDVLPVRYGLKDEVMVDAVYAPQEAREGQTVGLRVVLRATTPQRGLLQLVHDGEAVDLNGDRPGRGAPVEAGDWVLETGEAGGSVPRPSPATPGASGRYVTVKQIDLPLVSGSGRTFTGPNRFVAVFEPEGEGADAVSVNNRAEAFTLVQGKGRVLFVNNVGGGSGMILPNALAAEGVELDIVPGTGLPANLTRLQKYDAVILQNVPADQVTPPQQRMLASYVNDLGGGLIMVGGPESFGAGSWNNTPVDRILPVESQIPSQTILPSGALVIVMDRSGSMHSTVAGSNRTQIELAAEAASLTIQTLYPQDMVGVVVFDSDAQWIVPLGMNDNPGGTMQLLRSIEAGGGTSIYPGLAEAHDALANLQMQDAAIKHVILLTDGQSAPPPGGSWTDLMRKMTLAGITVSTVGVGDGHDAQTLSLIANMSGGQYHPITNPSQLPQIFVKEAKTIRKNLLKEVSFEPQFVQTGSPVMANFPGGAPPLRGLVLTGEKRDPRVFTPMLGPEGEPLFAHWQVGLGRSAAFTSDATNRWAAAWLSWGGYSDFWTRLVRYTARPSSSRNIDLATTVDGDTLRIRLDASAGIGGPGEAGFGNEMTVLGSVIRPDGVVENVELLQTGPGVYETSVPAADAGSYVVSVLAETADRQRHVAFGGTSRPPGEELRRFEPNLALLEQVAQITGGRVLDPGAAEPLPAGALFERTRAFESRSIRPLWRVLLPWLLLLVLLDVASRRIAWDPVAIAGWAKERARALRPRPREAGAEATLAALKQKRSETGARLRGEDPEAKPAAAPAAAAAPVPTDRKRKFEAGGDFVAQGDFAEAVGGARADTGQKAAAAQARGSDTPGSDDGPTTSRLLAAKRRARQGMDED